MPPSSLTSKVDHAFRFLREKIQSGQWPVGSNIPSEAELAAQCGCGRATVCKAIARLVHNGLVERRKRAGTRVLRAAPSPVAGIGIETFALVYPSEQHEGVWRSIQGFQQAAHKHGRQVVTFSTGGDFSKEAEFIGRLSEFAVVGAAICPLILSPADQLLLFQRLLKLNIPVALVDFYVPGFGYPSVVMDGFHAGYTMARHLYERGARNIGFFTNSILSASTFDRFRGYAWAVRELGLQENRPSLHLRQEMHPDFSDPLREPCALAKSFLEKKTGLDGVVCSDDHLAVGMVRAACEMGLRIPEDLRVAGIDDFAIAANNEIPITTYHSPCEEVGRHSFKLIDALLTQSAPIDPELRLRGDIVIRRST